MVDSPKELVVDQTMVSTLLQIIGQGIDFPVQYTRQKKVQSLALTNAGDCIGDSIHLILSTRIGERPFNPEFGSRLHQLVFEPSDAILHKLLRLYTAEALQRWEKRIEIRQISIMTEFNGDPATVGVTIYYRIRNTHIEGSYVYPFVREGMPTSNLYSGSEVARMHQFGALS